jgi:hypothetical protein
LTGTTPAATKADGGVRDVVGLALERASERCEGLVEVSASR